jgi:hypothetical protein
VTPVDQWSNDKQGQAAHGRRIAIVVLGCLLTVYDRCIRIIRSTWGSRFTADVDVFYLYGGQGPLPGRRDVVDVEQLIGCARPALQDGEVWTSGDIILCGAADLNEEQRNCILRKRLIAFGYLAKQRSYDFIYTVCATSYVDVDRLKEYVRTLPATGVYHGALAVHAQSGYPFVSGASFLLSRDIAVDLADNAPAIVATYPEDLPDDVAIGHFVASKHSQASVAHVATCIATESKPTDNQTFVMPYGNGSVDFVMAPAYSQVPDPRSYHFHFNSGRMWEMENFHRRFFAARGQARNSEAGST